MLTPPSLTLTLVLYYDLTNQMFVYSESKVETRGLYVYIIPTSLQPVLNKAFIHNQKPLISDHWGHPQGGKWPENILYRPLTPLNSPGTWAVSHIYQWSQVTTHVPTHCSMVWDSPGPGPFYQTALSIYHCIIMKVTGISFRHPWYAGTHPRSAWYVNPNVPGPSHKHTVVCWCIPQVCHGTLIHYPWSIT